MITILLKGGLGNQMFQYAAGRCFSIKMKTQLILDTSFLNYYPLKSGYTKRAFELNKFRINAKIVHNNKYFLSPLKNRLLFKTYFELNKYLRHYQIVNDANIDSLRVTNSSQNYLFDGHFQKAWHFHDIMEQLISEFNIKDNLDERSSTILNRIQNCETPVSIHVRRGDYLLIQNKTVHGLCGITYYEKAMNYIIDRLRDPVFFVFSDDIQWCKLNIKGVDSNIIYVDNSYASGPIDIFLMSKCHHNIIANSSFSWWGAWLNNNPQKMVIAPNKWFNNHDRNISMSDWKLL